MTKAPAWELEDDFDIDEATMRELDAIEAESLHSAAHGGASSVAGSRQGSEAPARGGGGESGLGKVVVSASALLPVECHGELEGEAVQSGKGKGKEREHAERMDVDVEEEDVKPIIKVTQEPEPTAKSSASTVADARLSGTTVNGTQVSRLAPSGDAAPSYVSTPPATPPPSTPPPAQRVLTMRQQATGPVTCE